MYSKLNSNKLKKHGVLIGVYCLNFDVAKDFYVRYLGFQIHLDEVINIEELSMRRLVLGHTLATQLQIEFINVSNHEKDRIGQQGGTTGLFSIPAEDLAELAEKMKEDGLSININEIPVATYVHLRDPMGNAITLYEFL